MGTRGGRRPGAGRKKGSKNKRKRADLIVRDYEAGLLPAPFMLSEMKRFIDMKTEDALKEARLIAVSIAPYFHPRLAAKQVSNIHEIGDKLDNLLREINGRPENTIIGRIRRPVLEIEQPLLDHGQGGAADAVQIELGAASPLERAARVQSGPENETARLHDADPAGDAGRLPVQSKHSGGDDST
jgi:hypothetical protein